MTLEEFSHKRFCKAGVSYHCPLTAHGPRATAGQLQLNFHKERLGASLDPNVTCLTPMEMCVSAYVGHLNKSFVGISFFKNHAVNPQEKATLSQVFGSITCKN